MPAWKDRIVLITGASSGIGQACARRFAVEGARLLLVARREERLLALAEEFGDQVRTLTLDVRDRDAVFSDLEALPESWREVELLVGNAGLSRGLDPLQSGNLEDWEEMIDTNVKGLLYVDRVVTPWMVARGRGTVIHIGSIAGRQVYPGGNVYCATKHAVRALTDALRIDLLGTGVRVGSVDPGMVETEFSEVRFHGDRKRADAVYRGIRPLRAEDVAETIWFAASLPDHVTLAEALLLPTDQASATHLHRKN